MRGRIIRHARQEKNVGKHTISGFYLGNVREHYHCHENWTIDTKSVRVGQTVFFKHKYLTDPVLTESDALLQASAELCEALKGSSSDIKGETKTAIDMLIDIFKKAATEATSATDDQQSAMAKAANDKKGTEASDPTSDLIPPEDIGDDDLRSSPNIAVSHGGPNLIEDDERPAHNTRAA